MTVRILIVEDEPLGRDALVEALQRDDREIVAVGDVEHALEQLPWNPHLALIDFALPDGTGLDIVNSFAAESVETRFTMITAQASVENVIDALRSGVDDYITKPFDLANVLASVERLERLIELEQHREVSLAVGQVASSFESRVEGMREAYRLAERAAPHRQPLLITGETGTGKTRLARAVHAMSPRSAAPFVPINCAALPETLIESELFGVRRGAFTGATSDRKGLVELADGGTLFLDEIGELSTAMQAKLLGVLEDRAVRRLGDHRERKVDVRVIAATHLELEAAVDRGEFRGDLFYRLNVLRVHLLPLRQRHADLPELVRLLLSELGSPQCVLDDAELERLQGYGWPGNLRELRNVLERAVLLAEGAPRPSAFLQPTPTPTSASATTPAEPDDSIQSLREVELAHIQRALTLCDGDRHRAAEALGTSVSTLRRRLMTAPGSD